MNTKQMKDMVCLVTGASSGLGFSMALGLAKTGATVVMLSRDPKRARKARIRLIAESKNPNIDLLTGDLSNLREVSRMADQVKSYYNRLDILANIAGTYQPFRRRTREGHELNLATNLLGPFLLTNLLLDLLVESAPATIINVSGESHRYGDLRLDDLQLERRSPFLEARRHSAMLRVIWTYELARRLQNTGVTANTFCPGWSRSNLFRHFPAWLRLPYECANYFLARRPEISMAPVVDFTLKKGLNGLNGAYFCQEKVVRSVPLTYQTAVAQRLWNYLELSTGHKGIPDAWQEQMRQVEF